VIASQPGPPRDTRLDELFVRYWDDILTDAEASELERRLAAHPADREWFRFLTLQAVATADLSAVARAGAGPQPPEAPEPSGRWSRRRALQYLGAGLAASLAVGVLGRRLMTTDTADPVRLTALRGAVEVRTADGMRPTAVGNVLPPGGVVVTRGLNSSAVLGYPDGTSVVLAGDSILTVAATGRRLVLRRGHATADIRPPAAGRTPLTLATTVATLTGLSGAVATLGRTVRAAEVGVHQGRVTVSDPAGAELAVVREGEMLTVHAGRALHKRPMPAAPDEYAWDLTEPLPDVWPVGRREVRADGPVVVPDLWFDPYHQAEMYQIRSHEPWSTGFFRLFPESVVRVRYRAARTGPGQVCFCARTSDPRTPSTGMLEYDGGFEATGPGEWRWVEVRAADMLDNKHPPRFGPPWVGFLVIFNTYELDLGLEVAEFRVARPGGPAGG
jgi:ferric-dicitrate binding protein FerR (iron transport regulator)